MNSQQINSDRRSSPRFNCSLQLNPKTLLTNISLSGLSFRSQSKYGIQDKFPLKLHNDQSKKEKSFEGNIVWLCERPNTTEYQYGLKFENLNQESSQYLREFLQSLSPSDARTLPSVQYRQPRYGTELLKKIRVKAELNDTYQAEVINLSKFGALLSLNSSVNNSFAGQIELLRLCADEEDLYSGKASIRYVENDSGGRKYGVKFLDASLNMKDFFRLIEQAGARERIATIGRNVTAATKVSRNFRIAVSDLRYILTLLKEELCSENALAEAFILNEVQDKFAAKVHSLLGDIEDIVKCLSSNEFELYKSYYRDNLLSLFRDAEVVKRAFDKPLGYAGDYETMNIIYDERPRGKLLWHKAINALMCSEPPAQAVRNRSNFLYKKIKKLAREKFANNSPVNIMSIACGPCKEMELFLSDSSNDVEEVSFYGLDQEVKALDYAQSRLADLNLYRGNKARLHFYDDSIGNIIKDVSWLKKYPSQDLIYSAGLFDYLDVKTSQKLISKLYGLLKPRGRLIIGNFSPLNPSRYLQEFGLDWYLIYRDDSEVKALVPADLSADRVIVEKEESGVNLFLCIEKSE